MDATIVDVVMFEWLHAVMRWLHLIAGIAWIGASFYFIHLDASLKARPGLPDGVGGEAWQVHGGGFYRMQKYLIAPPELPAELTWFKWEAYTTWASGFGLLIIVYYAGAELFLIDPNVLDLPAWAAISISIVSLPLGWLVYDRLCKSPLGRNDLHLALVGLGFIAATAVLYGQLFSARAAFLHVGALIGTIMAANVADIIIPNQRIIVAALRKGETPDPALGDAGKQRSLHNNYLTLPVVFIMIGSHHPLTYTSGWIWLVVTLLLVIGAAVRHFYNVRHAGRPSPWWTWAVAAAGLAGIVLVTWPGAGPADASLQREAAPERAETPDLAAVEEIILSRCSMCHAEEPVWEGVAFAPRGVMLDTPARIARRAAEIRLQAVLTDAMPPANVTEMTAAERRTLAAWLAARAEPTR